MKNPNVKDATLVGTQRERVAVGKWHNGRTPKDGPPDEIVVIEEKFYEKDGTEITDDTRIEAIKDAQADQVVDQWG